MAYEEIKDKLDEGIREYVRILMDNGVETFQSCQGGIGHPMPDPTVCFFGDKNEGLRVLHIALKNNLPVHEVRRVYSVQEEEAQSPYWEIVFKHDTSGHSTYNKETGFFEG